MDQDPPRHYFPESGFLEVPSGYTGINHALNSLIDRGDFMERGNIMFQDRDDGRVRKFSLPRPDIHWALFIDIDGTIAHRVPMLEDACITKETLKVLTVLQEKLKGAVALISSRSVKNVDQLCQPYIFTVAGQHGLEIRYSTGQYKAAPSIPAMAGAEQMVLAFHRMYRELYVEYKGLAIAVHYGQVPGLRDRVKEYLEDICKSWPDDLSLEEGKMVFEIKSRHTRKGLAIHQLMQDPPFYGRVPVFIGDDKADEGGFSIIHKSGGISIKAGEGETSACYRIHDVTQVEHWLYYAANALGGGGEREEQWIN